MLTVPVGAPLPLPASRPTVTISCCAVVIIVEDSETVIVGVIFGTAVTVTVFAPDAVL